jgi:hypothetical protein
MAIGLSRKHVFVAGRFKLLSRSLLQYPFVVALISTIGASTFYASFRSMHYIGNGIRWYPDIVGRL